MSPPGLPGDLTSRLQAALGTAYRLEKELGGGGMSRVFLAEEVRLGRKVVVKVLPPEMAAGVNVDRFEREIRLAARLQHPHIVPLLTAGAEGDLLYYIMPFIEGEALRGKLAREGELPVRETVRILREVLDALRYAHSHRVVHRDIKPDNILLSDQHALVTDFGVAKAVSESTGESSLTSLGVALGTPAYMAPEQAAADPHVDHRADIYAVGALAYEMLAGRPPFSGHTAQAVLMAHMTQAPEPVTAHRSAVPAGLNEIVLRCLEKKPADRWQRADEIIPHLDSILTPSGGLTPTATQPVQVPPPVRSPQPGPLRVAALFGLASVGVLALIYGLVNLLGLPDWVFVGAIGLLVVGLPIMLLTGHHERRRAEAADTGRHVTTSVGLRKVFTWRRALIGGGIGFAGLGLLASLFMASRLLGVGPAATLLSAGILTNQERLLLADFENATGDSTIAETATALLRIDLAQSPAIVVVQTAQVSEVLRRMQRDPSTPLTAGLADEVAQREGIKAFVAGEVRSVGSGYVLSASVLEAGTGRALVSVRETAADPGQLIEAVDRLSRKLRGRIGESLRTVRADPPLEQVTTSSLAALRLYAQAERVADEGDYDRAVALLERATEADSTFAMAWRRIGAYLTNPNRGREEMARGRAALERANALRTRLSDRERLFVEAMYAQRVESAPEAAATAYLAILEKHPADATALNNLGSTYSLLGRNEEARQAFWRAIDAQVAPSLTYGNVVFEELLVGQADRADSAARLLAERFTATSEVAEERSNIALARMDFASAETAVQPLLGATPEYQAMAQERLALLAEIQGRLAAADRAARQALRIQAERTGQSEEERDLLSELGQARRRAWYEADPASLVRRLDRLWERNRTLTAGRPVTQRHYEPFIRAYLRSGETRRARQLLDEFLAGQTESERAVRVRRFFNGVLETEVLVGEGRGSEAAIKGRETCGFFPTVLVCREANVLLGEAFDRSGQADSAIGMYERFATVQAFRPPEQWPRLPAALRRLGELHESRGDIRKAIESYSRFVELWKDADPELEPLVRDVRERIARLSREAG